MVELILNEMKSLIAKHQLNLLQTYPNDLLVYDRENLERFAHCGATIAWVVGHNHTHIVNLGLHPEENDMVHCLTKLASTDHFYQIKIFADDVAFKEVDRDGFRALGPTPVPYTKIGGDDNFALFKIGLKVGQVQISAKGNYRDRVYNLKITAESSATKLDHAALHLWADKMAAHIAGSLFIKIQVEFAAKQRLAEFA